MEESPNVFVQIFSALWEVWKEMFGVVVKIIPKVVSFCVWVLLGILLLPCVFIAGSFYPAWVEWGEGI